MEFCCTNSSSILWWTTCAPSGGLPLTAILGNCRCFSPCVFALLPVQLGTLVTSKFTRTWEFLFLPTTSGLWEIRLLKVSWCGKPLSYAARQLTKLWPGFLKAGRSGSTTSPGYPQKTAMSIHWIVLNWHFSTTLTEVLLCFFLQFKANASANHEKMGHGPHFFHVRRLNLIAT